MIPIPVNVPSWVLKGGAVFLFLFAIFYSGCYTQKQRDMSKIQKINDKYDRCVEIVDIFQDNYDTIEKGLNDQNKAIEELGRESERRISSLRKAHQEAVTDLERNYNRTLSRREKEAAELRKRLAGLSVGEACTEAWISLATE
jgi:uncharacterized protein YhaN